MTAAYAPPVTVNTVALRTDGYRDEYPANASSVITPGMLVTRQTDGSILPHAVAGGRGEKIFALEDALQGRWFWDQTTGAPFFFTALDPVPTVYAEPGDHILAVIPANAPAYSIGAALMSNGDGTLTPFPTSLATVLSSAVVASDALSALAVATPFLTTVQIPASSLQVGDILHIRVRGVDTGVNGTDTQNWQLLMGTTVLAATGATATPSAGWIAFIDVTIVVTAVGASGSITGMGVVGQGLAGTVTAKGITLAATAKDTTSAAALLLTVTMTQSANNAGNVSTLVLFEVEVLRSTAAGNPVPVAYALSAVNNSASSNIARAPVQVI